MVGTKNEEVLRNVGLHPETYRGKVLSRQDLHADIPREVVAIVANEGPMFVESVVANNVGLGCKHFTSEQNGELMKHLDIRGILPMPAQGNGFTPD